MWRRWLLALAGLCVCLLPATQLLDSPDRQARHLPLAANRPFPDWNRVAVLVLENREYRDIIGNPQGRYLTRLARRHALATRYYALGHPSLPNYLALTAGSTFGVHRDCNGCDFESPNVLGQLDGAGISWKAYFESLPRAGYLGTRRGRYSKHLNPFVYSRSLMGRAPDRSRIVPLRALGNDLRAHRLPRFVWIAPNLCHDSHYCSVRNSDRYAAHLVPRVLRALGPRSILFVTWDEGTTHAGALGSRGGGHIALIAAGPAARQRAVSQRATTHYALLRTIEAGFDLPALGRAGSPSTHLLTGLIRARAG